MYKYKCLCGNYVILYRYSIHLEGTITFRRYEGQCKNCSCKIDTINIHDEDLIDQQYLC